MVYVFEAKVKAMRTEESRWLFRFSAIPGSGYLKEIHEGKTYLVAQEEESGQTNGKQLVLRDFSEEQVFSTSNKDIADFIIQHSHEQLRIRVKIPENTSVANASVANTSVANTSGANVAKELDILSAELIYG